MVFAAVSAGAAGCWLWRGNGDLLELPGVVEVQEIRLGSKIGGRIAEVLAWEGELVEANQVLLKLECPELLAQRQQWQSRLRAAEAELTKAKNGARVEERDAAKAAVDAAVARFERLKAGWREEEIRRSRADADAAEADFVLTRDEFERTKRLYQQKSISKADFEAAQANRNRAEGKLASAKAQLDMLYSGTRKEDIAESAAELRRIQANLQLLLSGTRAEDVAAAEAAVAEIRGKLAEIEANLREAEVRSPDKAILETLAVRKGDVIAPNQTVIRILRASDLWVKAYVPETLMGKIRLHQEVEVTIDSYPDRRFPGKVIQVASISEFTPRNVQSADERKHQVFGVKVQVQDADGIFKAGMAATVWLRLSEAPAP
jgi:multidrug resistance efflux pump